MSKVILVMDKPKSCSKCKFLYEFQGVKKCQLMNVLYDGNSKLSQDNFTVKRHDKCPLKELPKKQTIHNTDTAHHRFAKGGYNNCIDTILKEGAE